MSSERLPPPPKSRSPAPASSTFANPAQSGFEAAGIYSALPSEETPAENKGKNRRRKKNKPGKKQAEQTEESGDGYEPVPVPAPEELMSVYKICLARADQTFPAEMCRNPLPMLAAVIGILTATEACPTIPDVSKT